MVEVTAHYPALSLLITLHCIPLIAGGPYSPLTPPPCLHPGAPHHDECIPLGGTLVTTPSSPEAPYPSGCMFPVAPWSPLLPLHTLVEASETLAGGTMATPCHALHPGGGIRFSGTLVTAHPPSTPHPGGYCLLVTPRSLNRRGENHLLSKVAPTAPP